MLVGKTYQAAPPQAASVRFGGLSDEQQYSPMYQSQLDYNGAGGEEFALSALTQRYPTPEDVLVWDIGAGDGRNTIPLAQAGYRVLASELSDHGRIAIMKRAQGAAVGDRVIISKDNVLESSLSEPRDFALMSHVSQHFSLDELRKALTHMCESVKEKGSLLFDALFRKAGFESLPLVGNEQHRGCCHFSKPDVLDVLSSLGCEAEVVDYTMTNTNRTFYLVGNNWGRDELGRGVPKPVELQWVLAKKTSS